SGQTRAGMPRDPIHQEVAARGLAHLREAEGVGDPRRGLVPGHGEKCRGHAVTVDSGKHRRLEGIPRLRIGRKDLDQRSTEIRRPQPQGRVLPADSRAADRQDGNGCQAPCQGVWGTARSPAKMTRTYSLVHESSQDGNLAGPMGSSRRRRERSGRSLLTAITFGTSGWRAVIAEDFTFANARRVVAAIAGVLAEEGRGGGLVLVGFDTRFLAARFASEAARLLAREGFQAELSARPIPTP